MNQHLARILVHGYKAMIKRYLAMPAFKGVRIFTVDKQDDAPQTLHTLREYVKEHGRLIVALEHGETSIYGDAKANAWFRAFHDLGHLVYNREMTYEEEVQLALTQWGDLVPIFREMGATRNLIQDLYRLYLFDTVGQSRYCLLTGRFPNDQMAFVENLHAVLDWEVAGADVVRGVDMLVKNDLFPESV
jgi:hypothetical protein